MIVALHIPRFPLVVALRAARRPAGLPVALAPEPGAAQVVGLCTPEAEAEGVRTGLRVGEALARCPSLELVAPDPDAAAEAAESIVVRLEGIGAAVEPGTPGTAWFAAPGLLRLHGGLDGVLARAWATLPVGAGGRIGVAHSRFAALQAARAAERRSQVVLDRGEAATMLAPLPVETLAEDGAASADVVAALAGLGLTTLGHVAALTRADLRGRLGPAGERVWRITRGEEVRALRPRVPPRPLEARFDFPDDVGARSALDAAARLLVEEVSGRARASGRAFRSITLRARLADGGSWSRELPLREASADPRRLLLVVLPALAGVEGPVSSLLVRGDASGEVAGRQLALVRSQAEERGGRAREAARQVGATLGPDVVLRAVELEPWSRLPERRWALVPYER